jgi:hypothetical protein
MRKFYLLLFVCTMIQTIAFTSVLALDGKKPKQDINDCSQIGKQKVKPFKAKKRTVKRIQYNTNNPKFV